MKSAMICLSALLLLSVWGYAQRAHAVRPGMRTAEKLDPNNVPPQIVPRPVRTDPAKLRADAAELARLAQSVPPEVSEVTNGRLPQDLNQRLKEIEKLAKQLRREVSH